MKKMFMRPMYVCFLLLAFIPLFYVSKSFSFEIPAALETIHADDGSLWERVNVPGFASDNNFSVVAMAEFQGRIYAMTRNEVEGLEVWRTVAQGWEQVPFPGGILNGVYGNPFLNNLWGEMKVFQGKLYFGFSSGLQGAVLKSTGCEIWRYDGTTWEPVITDKKDIDESGTITAISGCSDADGDTTAQVSDSTKSWIPDQWSGDILQITSGDGKYRKFIIVSNTANTLIIQQDEVAGNEGSEFTLCSSKTYNNPFPPYSYTVGAVQIGDSYEIGRGWDESGFGDMWNKTITDMEIFEGKLYVSTGLNYENGAQVWYTEDGDNWSVTQPSNSFGNYHPDATYPLGQKPVSSSITNLCVSSVSGVDVLYAGGTGTTGDLGGCSRMAKLTETGWELIVDVNVDGNDTGTNENGFGDGMSCDMFTGNFMPWSLASFHNKLFAGINSLGGLRILYSNDGSSADDSWFYSVGGDSGFPEGFDGVLNGGTPYYQNIALNLFVFNDELYGGVVSMYAPSLGATEAYLTGSQIWKSKRGIGWKKVTGNGFGDTDIINFEAFTSFNGTLYVSGSKGANSSTEGLGGAKIFRLAAEPCVQVQEDQSLANRFLRYTVTGMTTELPELPDPDPSDPEGFIGAAQLTVGDINGDGIKEILCSSGVGADSDGETADGAIGLFTWDGAHIDDWTQTVIYDQFAFPNETLLRDIDSDGDTDIVVMDKFLFGTAPGGIYFLENQGGAITNPANWTKRTIFEDPAGNAYHRAYFVDLDGDGAEDIITTRLLDGWTGWCRNEGNGNFSAPYEIGTGGGSLFAMIDIDGDGDLDIVATQLFITVGFSNEVDASPAGDSLLWFENPGTTWQVFFPWNRYTIDYWYTSFNPVGKGFEVIVSDIDNDGVDELVVTTHNHQMYDSSGKRLWPSGVYYFEIPGRDGNTGDPRVTADWVPLTIETGDSDLDPDDWNAVLNDVYAAERRGGCCYYDQGSPGIVSSADINNDGQTDLVVAGDGKGALYYYEGQGSTGSCLSFTRASLFAFPESMPAEAKIADINNDGLLDIVASVFDTSVTHPHPPYVSSSIFVFINKGTPTLVHLDNFSAVSLFKKVRITWSTKTEVDNAGFNLYRAEEESGSYTKINDILIAGKGSSTSGESYEFIDRNVKSGKAYYYKLEDIDLRGTSTFHGPVSATPGVMIKK